MFWYLQRDFLFLIWEFSGGKRLFSQCTALFSIRKIMRFNGRKEIFERYRRHESRFVSVFGFVIYSVKGILTKTQVLSGFNWNQIYKRVGSAAMPQD